MDEQTLLADVVSRLTGSYPMSADVIAEVVNELHATFNGAPVRDYVPLFVNTRPAERWRSCRFPTPRRRPVKLV